MENAIGAERRSEGETILIRLERTATMLEETSERVDRRLGKVCVSPQPSDAKECSKEVSDMLPVYLAGLREQIVRIEKANDFINDVMSRCEI